MPMIRPDVEDLPASEQRKRVFSPSPVVDHVGLDVLMICCDSVVPRVREDIAVDVGDARLQQS